MGGNLASYRTIGPHTPCTGLVWDTHEELEESDLVSLEAPVVLTGYTRGGTQAGDAA